METTSAVPKWAPDFQAQLQFPAELMAQPIPLADQLLATQTMIAPSRTSAHTRISIPTDTPSSPKKKRAKTPALKATNDDRRPPNKRKKRPSRRKPKRNDKRRNRRSMVISKKDYEGGMHAFGRAFLKNLQLDTMVTLRPADFDHLNPDERHAWCMRRIKALGQWFSDNDNRPEFAALWSREAKKVVDDQKVTAEGEHMHILVHAGENRADLERMLRKSLKGRNEVDVRPATQEVMRLDCGWFGDAATYVLKAVSQQVWKAHRTIPHRPSGPIWGTRCGWTNNIAS